MPFEPVDPVELTAKLIRCPSVTPEEGGAIRLLETVLGSSATELQAKIDAFDYESAVASLRELRRHSHAPA